MGFHEVRFPAALSFGSVGGPERRTEIVTLSNGEEERSTPWAHSRRRYDAGIGMRSLDDIDTLIAFFEARGGQLYGFRWKDWADFKSCRPSMDPTCTDQQIATGDGVTTVFKLVKNYWSGTTHYCRTIAKPIAGTVKVALGGDEREQGEHYVLDVNAGTVAFDVPPGPGVPISAGFEFDVPVRFDTDRITVSVASFSAGEIPSVPIVEVRR